MEGQTPLVSVVIPTYNRGELILKTIGSVLNQTYKNIEIIIVDDNSTDNTKKIISTLSDPRINYIKLERNTKGREARNRGIMESKGKFIAFLDSDDCWLPNKIESQLKYMYCKANNLDNILCFTDLIQDNGRWKKRKTNKSFHRETNIMEYILAENNIVQTSTYIISTILAQDTLFNPTLPKHQDWDFCLRLTRKNANFLHFPIATTIWNVEKRKDRISLGSKFAEHSVEWVNNNNMLSKKAQYGFKVSMFFDELLRRKHYWQALHLLYNAKKYKSISSYVVIKKVIIMAMFAFKLRK